MRRRGWIVVVGLLALVGAVLGGGVWWSRTLSARIVAERARVAELGVPLSLEELEACYLEALGPERAAPLPIDGLVARVQSLLESDWPDGPFEAGPDEPPSEAQLLFLDQHRELLDGARVALEQPGRRVPVLLDPLDFDFGFQSGLRGLVQLAVWDAERLGSAEAPVDEVILAWRLVLDLADVYAAVPHTLAQMERIANGSRVWNRVRPTLLRAPGRAVELLERLGHGPAEGAALRAIYLQAVLVAEVERLFERGAGESERSGLELPAGGGLLWSFWQRRGIPPLYAHLADTVPLLESRDLPELQALDDHVRRAVDDEGELFGLLVFQASHLLEMELAERDAWAVTRAGAVALQHRAQTGEWPAVRPRAAGVPGYQSEASGLEVTLGAQTWDLPEAR